MSTYRGIKLVSVPMTDHLPPSDPEIARTLASIRERHMDSTGAWRYDWSELAASAACAAYLRTVDKHIQRYQNWRDEGMPELLDKSTVDPVD